MGKFLSLRITLFSRSKTLCFLLTKKIFDDNSKLPHHLVELEEKPLLYEYYSNTLNPIIDRRNIDEMESGHTGKRSATDGESADRYAAKRYFLERPRPIQDQQQKQQRNGDYPLWNRFYVFLANKAYVFTQAFLYLQQITRIS